jgi:hypothetical protein
VAHPEVDIEKTVSTYYIANEMANMAESLDRIIDPEDWQPIVQADQVGMAEWLIRLAKLAQLRKYKKHPRGKKKPARQRKNDSKKPHVATARLLKK